MVTLVGRLEALHWYQYRHDTHITLYNLHLLVSNGDFGRSVRQPSIDTSTDMCVIQGLQVQEK